MNAQPSVRPLDAGSAALARAAQIMRDTSSSIVALSRAADHLQATAAVLLASSTGVDHASGLSSEAILRLDARLVDGDARRLCQLADTVRLMPALARALSDGVVSTSQAMAISSETRACTPAGRARIDQHVRDHAPTLTNSEPEQLLDEVRDLVWADRADLARARETRRHERNFLALQASFDGGGRLYGHADAIGFATITARLDAETPDPTRTRVQQRMDSLIALCENGGGQRRTRPRFLVTTSLEQLADLGASEAARILTSTFGRPQRITPLSTQMLACDADLIPIITLAGQPIGIGDTRATIPAKIRTALIARDGGCRFPGCKTPASWADAHHIQSRAHGGDARLDNLVLLCRRCHRRIHTKGWQITPGADDTITFTHRRHRYHSHPRARPPTRA